MKKLLLILFCLPLLIMAQAPQGFTYQGVATDNNGFELQNQTISIQASILSSSATGTTVWQETHTTTTDTFGLFNVTIGEGISTNGGSSATFQEIDWGAASHFMKVEIDVNGGSNYVHVGTSQMMSVPYALYADKVNMDSVSSYLSIDSTFLNNIGISLGSSIKYSGYFPEWISNTGLCSDDIPDVFKSSNSYYSNGDFSLSGGPNDYCNFVINYGDVMHISGTVILRVADTLIINGTIDGFASGGNIGTLSTGGRGGTCSGAYGSTYCGSSGNTSNANMSYNLILNEVQELSGGSGGAGEVRNTINYGPCNDDSPGGSGLIIICDNLVFNGNIDLRGSDGDVSVYCGVCAGAGGGAGGSIIINANNVIENSGTINTSGGNGATGSQGTVGGYPIVCTSGQNGGDGFIFWLDDE